MGALTPIDVLELLDIEKLEAGEKPHPDIVEQAITILVRRYPHGGNQLERALREAFRLGWRGRHILSLIRQENQHGC